MAKKKALKPEEVLENASILRQARLVILLPSIVFMTWAWWTGRLRWSDPNLLAFALTATLSTALWLRLVRTFQPEQTLNKQALDLQSPGLHQ